jgi:hypothetical protein
MVYVIYMTKIGMVDGIKWCVKDHQQRSCHAITRDRHGAGDLGLHTAAAQEAAAGTTVGWYFTARSRRLAMLGGPC